MGQIRIPADRAEPIRIGGTDDKQRIDRIGYQRLDGGNLLFGVAQGAGDHRTHAALARIGVEALAHGRKEAVVVNRQDHADQPGLGLAQTARQQIGEIALLRSKVANAPCGFLADPAALPGAVEHRADRRSRGLAGTGNVVDRRFLPFSTRQIDRHCRGESRKFLTELRHFVAMSNIDCASLEPVLFLNWPGVGPGQGSTAWFVWQIA